MASAVLLQSLGNGSLWDSSGHALMGHQVFVYQRGTTTQVPVYTDATLTSTLTQPLLTGSNGANPGGIPGWVAAEQALDFYDFTAGQRQPAEPVAASDVASATAGNPRSLDRVFYAAAYGVLANGKCVTDAAISASSSQLSSASAAFSQADVGKLIAVNGAGTPSTGLTQNSIPAGVPGPTWTAASGNWVSIGASFAASGGAISHVQDVLLNSGAFSSNGVGGNFTVTLTGVTAGHGLLLEFCSYNDNSGTTFAVTDNVGGTWNPVTSTTGNIGANSTVELWECESSPGGNVTITVTVTAGGASSSAQGASAWASEWAHLGAPDSVPTPTSGSGTTVTPPGVAYQSGELVVLTAFTAGVISASPSSPYTLAEPTWFAKQENQSAWQVTSSSGSTNSQITSITLASPGLSAAVPSGGGTLTGGGRSQTFATPGAAAGATSLPVVAQVPAFTFPAGSTVSTINPPLQTTIQSVSAGVATLSAAAGTTVSNAVGFYASDDTTAAQAAISAAQAVMGTVEFPDGFIGLSQPLVSNQAIKIKGQSCKPLYGGFSESAGGYNWPGVPPYFAGTVLWQFSPATDALQLSATGNAQDLEDFGILFPGLNYNTGHGVNVTGMRTYEGHPDQGCNDCDWDHIYVMGHDGSHYGFNVLNTLYPRFGKLRSFGGGGMHYWQNSIKGFNGNITAIDCYSWVWNCGLAHGLFIDDQSTPLGGGAFDFSIFLRWQTWISNDSEGTIPGVLGVYVGTAQELVAVNGEIWTANNGVNGFIFVGPDMETSAQAQMSTAAGLYTASLSAGIPYNSYD